MRTTPMAHSKGPNFKHPKPTSWHRKIEGCEAGGLCKDRTSWRDLWSLPTLLGYISTRRTSSQRSSLTYEREVVSILMRNPAFAALFRGRVTPAPNRVGPTLGRGRSAGQQSDPVAELLAHSFRAKGSNRVRTLVVGD
ncbi:hypothetical protein EVAR_103182_1 [Eumeta japonica]|uniref:Uncharacterized protein n=1 Tax=Eumeta variegata TaxID=151549 RepID=A0A4C1YFB1_EUMVA|nr:hypothetical protein EVAR_103182_1 [Eumeta japonica]